MNSIKFFQHCRILQNSLRFFLTTMVLAATMLAGEAFTDTARPAYGNPAQALSAGEVTGFLNQWGDGIVKIGKMYQAGGDYKTEAKEMITLMYGYDDGKVLFKPTKAAENQFRGTMDQALSYFVGGLISEDHGFALQPWSRVRFESHDITMDQDSAAAMGNYYFTDGKTGKEVKVEYSFGIKRAADGRPVIFLHHSSLPYIPAH